MTRVVALITCHNRRDLTLRCLDRLAAQRAAATLDVIVVDDGSTDGTAAAIRREHPDVTVLHSDGTSFWVGGMRTAFAHVADAGYDYYLLVNDDIDPHPAALASLLSTAHILDQRGDWPAVVVGSTTDPDSGQLTYGGVRRRHRLRRVRFDRVEPEPLGGRPVEVETMNTNFVLIPRAVVDRIGFFDCAFTQSFADFDYGLRAREAGCSVWIAPGFIGSCPRNPPLPPLKWRAELQRLFSVKGGLAPHEWVTFCRRWAGLAWPLYVAIPYARRIAGRLGKSSG